jgi:hypothetical protein
MKRRQDKMSDSPTCKQQKTAKEEEAPNSLLSLLKETLQYCIAFVGKGHYQFVGSIYKQINKIYANEVKDMKVTFWSNVAEVGIWQNCALKTMKSLDEEYMRCKAWLLTSVKWQQSWEM